MTVTIVDIHPQDAWYPNLEVLRGLEFEPVEIRIVWKEKNSFSDEVYSYTAGTLRYVGEEVKTLQFMGDDCPLENGRLMHFFAVKFENVEEDK